MPFQALIRELLAQLANCRDDEMALKLAQELQAVLSERIDQLRAQVKGLPLLERRDHDR